jgi:hypothetical protein
MKRHLVVLIVMAQLIGACAPTSSPSPATALPSTILATPGSTASPATPPTRSPGPSTTPPAPSLAPDIGFATNRATRPGDRWTGLDWRRLKPSDPVAGLRRVTAWSGGFIAIGAPVGDGAAVHTPIWTSIDGASWVPLSLPFGPGAITTDIVEVGGVLVTLTLQGTATSECEPVRFARCVARDGPLRAWSSTNGRDWHEGLAPATILPGHEIYELDAPELVASADHALAADLDVAWAAVSSDGVNWVTVGDAMPAGLESRPGTIAGLGSSLVAIGTHGRRKDTRAALFESADGASWTTIPLETTLDGITFGLHLVAAADGLIAIGAVGGAPAPELWWGRLDGRRWEHLAGYPPLGTWYGNELGSGLGPNGYLVGDGVRMLAYGADAKPRAWLSADGTTWTSLAISGRAPETDGRPDVGTFILTSLGVLFLENDGSAWFAEPLSG